MKERHAHLISNHGSCFDGPLTRLVVTVGFDKCPRSPHVSLRFKAPPW